MRLKSYFAGTVEAALSLARQELGPEAMLVDSRKSGIEARHLGEYEVICAVFPALETAASEPEPAPLLSPVRAPGFDKLSQEVSELKRYMERMAANLARSSAAFANLRANPERAEAFGILAAADVDPALAHDLVMSADEQLTPGTDLNRLLRARIGELAAADTSLTRITAFAGPPGSGKTTSLVKLAARYGLTTRRPCQILSLDTYRVGAAEQLRSYAAILGIGFQVAETTAALAQALEECRNKDLIFIDTPGFSRREMEEAKDMARFLSTYPGLTTHLVLPASMKGPDQRRILEDYAIFEPGRLLFTRLDETETFGGILNAIVQTEKPVSFLSYGQQIPEDLEPASKDLLAGMVLRRRPDREEGLNAAVAAA